MTFACFTSFLKGLPLDEILKCTKQNQSKTTDWLFFRHFYWKRIQILSIFKKKSALHSWTKPSCSKIVLIMSSINTYTLFHILIKSFLPLSATFFIQFDPERTVKSTRCFPSSPWTQHPVNQRLSLVTWVTWPKPKVTWLIFHPRHFAMWGRGRPLFMAAE